MVIEGEVFIHAGDIVKHQNGIRCIKRGVTALGQVLDQDAVQSYMLGIAIGGEG